MFRQSIIKATRTSFRSSFSTSTRVMAGGDTGAPRSGGAATGDAFTKREKGMEDYAIREREKEKARELLAKIKVQEESLNKIKEHLEALQKDDGANDALAEESAKDEKK